MARVAATSPGARVTVIAVRGGRTRAFQVAVDRLPLESRRVARAADPTDFGLTLGDVTRAVGFASAGAMVLDVRDGSAAARAGIETGDVVLKVNQHTVHAASDAMRELQGVPISLRTGFVLISREGDELLVELERD
jgi:S1-C subfamily serine protease